MRRISILALILCGCFVSMAWAQEAGLQRPRSHFSRHHAMTNSARSTGTGNPYFTQSNTSQNKVWELGTFPGGTWFASWRLNDYGVIVGRGDVPPIGSDGVGRTHTLVVHLFGPRAGEWIDLGALHGKQPKGWEEPNNDIANTGMVVSRSTAWDGHVHAVAWTKETGMVNLGTLADTGMPRYATYKSSMATGTNRLGTLIVGQGWSGDDAEATGVPVVWTPSTVWKNGKLVTRWKIQRLHTAAFPELTGFVAWGVNDYGQIVGTGWNEDFTILTAILWNLRPDGKGWQAMSLPPSTDYPAAQVYAINDRGEMVGVVNSADQSVWLPRLWKPLNLKRTLYSQPIELPLPKGGFTNGEAVGINERGDVVGDCWNDDASLDLSVGWSTRNTTVAEVLNFPGDWGFAWGVNNNRIATVTYGGGENCSAGSCGGAIHLP